jgi:hypothetical protein
MIIDTRDIEYRVAEDIFRRQATGLKKYGVSVKDNPLPLRDWLQHQYEELLDAAIYCRRAIEEIDNVGKTN